MNVEQSQCKSNLLARISGPPWAQNPQTGSNFLPSHKAVLCNLVDALKIAIAILWLATTLQVKGRPRNPKDYQHRSALYVIF